MSRIERAAFMPAENAMMTDGQRRHLEARAVLDRNPTCTDCRKARAVIAHGTPDGYVALCKPCSARLDFRRRKTEELRRRYASR